MLHNERLVLIIDQLMLIAEMERPWHKLSIRLEQPPSFLPLPPSPSVDTTPLLGLLKST